MHIHIHTSAYTRPHTLTHFPLPFLFSLSLSPRYIFKVITVERPKKLREVLAANGYTYVKDHGDFGDEMWIHKSLKNFNEVMAKHHVPKN